MKGALICEPRTYCLIYHFTELIKCNLHNYFNLRVCPSFRRRRFTFEFPIYAFGSQSGIDKSCLICVSEKHVILVTTRPFGPMRWGEAKLHTLQHKERRSQGKYTNTNFSVSSPPQCRSQAIVGVMTLNMMRRLKKHL